jgi:hypothetical protein
MMETITSFNQGDTEWHKARIGSLGGSSIGKAVAKGEGKVRKQLLYDMVGEILAGEKKETFKTVYMEEGIKYEGEARDLYAFKFDIEVEEIAMFRDGPHKHASPDGIPEQSIAHRRTWLSGVPLLGSVPSIAASSRGR